MKVCLTYSVLLWVLVMLLPKVFAGIFSGDAELIAFTGWALRIYTACLFMMGIQIACQMTFISIGNAKDSIIVAIMRKFVLLLPPDLSAAKLSLENQTMAVYLAEPVADLIAVDLYDDLCSGHNSRKHFILCNPWIWKSPGPVF